MAGFVALQLVFDAVLLFAILFLFHFTVSRVHRKKDDENLIRSLEVEEIKQDLQELLVTLKQVGSEASEGIQQKVKEAEAKTKRLKDLLRKLDTDMSRISHLSQEMAGERERLDEKWGMMQAARRHRETPAPDPRKEEPKEAPGGNDPAPTGRKAPSEGKEPGEGMAFSPEAVREIYELADASMDVSEIARRTRLTRGEVQLILNLRGNRFTTSN